MQLTEHESVQVIWQVELPLHDALPLGPMATVQVELPVQLRLHDLPHEPAQSVWAEQEMEQLPAPPPQVASLKEHCDPELQVQLEPLQTGGGGAEEPPHDNDRDASAMVNRVRMSKA